MGGGGGGGGGVFVDVVLVFVVVFSWMLLVVVLLKLLRSLSFGHMNKKLGLCGDVPAGAGKYHRTIFGGRSYSARQPM